MTKYIYLRINPFNNYFIKRKILLYQLLMNIYLVLSINNVLKIVLNSHLSPD